MRAGRLVMGLLLVAIAATRADAQTAPPAAGFEADIAPGVRRVLALDGDPVAGEAAYEGCAVCHLPNGRGRPDGTFPQLAGQHREVIVKQLVDIREGRRSNPLMAPYAEALIDEREIADVAAYIETLPAPPAALQRTGEADPATTAGGALYQRDCSGCHGARGEGHAQRFVPVLAGQHEAYLLRQIRAIAAGRRANAHPVMQRAVSDYDDAELEAVVRHAVGLPGPERSHN
jgi:cytochrome c553